MIIYYDLVADINELRHYLNLLPYLWEFTGRNYFVTY